MFLFNKFKLLAFIFRLLFHCLSLFSMVLKFGGLWSVTHMSKQLSINNLQAAFFV